MNREIKFRVWKTNLKCFAIFDLNFTSDILSFKDCINCTVETIHKDINENSIITQFTGLTDKHGKEIYEGDLVKDTHQNIYKVIWDKYMFNLDDYYDQSADYPTIAFSEGVFEVVGNIYETIK